MKPKNINIEQLYRNYAHKALYWRPTRTFLHYIRKLVLPGFQGVPLFDVLKFFIKSLLRGSITSRAKALSFSFFMALFPMLLFMFTLLPYFPVQGILEELYTNLQEILPTNIYSSVIQTINEVFSHKHNTLLSVGFLATMFVSVNGMDSIIQAFNHSSNTIESRSFLKRKLICLYLVIILYFLITFVLSIMLGYKKLMLYFTDMGILTKNFWYYALYVGRWIISVALTMALISSIYYIAPVKKQRLGFVSAGSTLSTILFFLTTGGFNFYISNFSKYNALYGSIGTLIIFMLWIYLSACILLIGYELNISIVNSKIHQNLLMKEEEY